MSIYIKYICTALLYSFKKEYFNFKNLQTFYNAFLHTWVFFNVKKCISFGWRKDNFYDIQILTNYVTKLKNYTTNIPFNFKQKKIFLQIIHWPLIIYYINLRRIVKLYFIKKVWKNKNHENVFRLMIYKIIFSWLNYTQ